MSPFRYNDYSDMCQDLIWEFYLLPSPCPLFWLVGLGCFVLFIDTMKYQEFDRLQPLKTIEYNSLCFIVIIKTDLFARFRK